MDRDRNPGPSTISTTAEQPNATLQSEPAHDPTHGTVVVTGASRGLGLLLAKELAHAGTRVGLIGRDQHALAGACSSLREQGATVMATPCDVTDENALPLAFERAMTVLGPIDAVIANAGMAPDPHRGHNMSLHDWQRTLDVNLTGAFLTARAAHPHLAATNGSLVFTGSVMARTPRPGLSAYASSKAGLEGLTRALAVDWARDDIRVNAVAVGFLSVGLGRPFSEYAHLHDQVCDRTLMNRLGSADDMVAIFRYLTSSSSRFITGQIINVDGGYGLR